MVDKAFPSSGHGGHSYSMAKPNLRGRRGGAKSIPGGRGGAHLLCGEASALREVLELGKIVVIRHGCMQAGAGG